ncbi:glycerophosphodiester phosphodiesterase [Clostridium tarantellae]|uniref:Glycerophosphodiester phosphodiesterase n=1 Tax=Clostridium tarantellae TaxID=39493 RepID=A0A6I1MKG7_9CLOT|nr:glycerophosphodiester phosphodiesterase [Clostridium tarantellae]MPQ43885.1 glycerophosphodiester phosphodiesterase [Clostridium tarantellae]
MINFAHRGACGDFPENTMLAFKAAIRLGATGIELDVQKTKDDKLVVIHDEDIERTFKGKGLVKDYTLEELKKFKCRKVLFENNEECVIPTLEEVLKLIKETEIYLNVELKTDEIQYINIEEDVIYLLNKYNLKNRTIISSFNHTSLEKCKEIDNEISTALLYESAIHNIIDYAKNLKVDALHPALALVTEELIKKAHENNLKVNIYTVNNPKNMRALIKENADGIFTDYTGLLKDIIEENNDI